MSAPTLILGNVIEWDGFVKSDGEKEPKLFIVVGVHPDKNYLCVRATSKKKHREYQPSDDADYYYIPGGGREFFDLDTWILFSEPQEFWRTGVDREFDDNRMRVMGCLRFQIANEICNRMKKCDDVGARYQALLGPPR